MSFTAFACLAVRHDAGLAAGEQTSDCGSKWHLRGSSITPSATPSFASHAAFTASPRILSLLAGM